MCFALLCLENYYYLLYMLNCILLVGLDSPSIVKAVSSSFASSSSPSSINIERRNTHMKHSQNIRFQINENGGKAVISKQELWKETPLSLQVALMKMACLGKRAFLIITNVTGNSDVRWCGNMWEMGHTFFAVCCSVSFLFFRHISFSWLELV